MKQMHLIVLGLFLMAGTATSYTCNCYCPTSTNYVGFVYSGTCSSTGCQSACISGSASSSCSSASTTYGVCQTVLSYTCTCLCSTSLTSNSSSVGTSTSTACSSSACQSACRTSYPSSCGTFTNNGYCSDAFDVQPVASTFILSKVAAIYLYSKRM